MQGVWVRSLVGELRILHALWPKKQNINNRSNSVTNSVKALKLVHIEKKNLLKKKVMDQGVQSGGREAS